SFPVKVGPGLHRTGFPDAFVAKVNPDGGLVWAGYLGGREEQEARGIAVDSAGNVYVAGVTRSDETTFPVTVGPGLTFQGGNSLGEDAFVAKLSSKPDLVELLVTPFSPIVLNEKPGDSFTVKDAVANRGLGTAPSSKVRYYLSTD